METLERLPTSLMTINTLFFRNDKRYITLFFLVRKREHLFIVYRWNLHVSQMSLSEVKQHLISVHVDSFFSFVISQS